MRLAIAQSLLDTGRQGGSERDSTAAAGTVVVLSSDDEDTDPVLPRNTKATTPTPSVEDTAEATAVAVADTTGAVTTVSSEPAAAEAMPRVVDAPPLPVEEDSCLETQHPPPPASIPVIPEDVAMHRAKLVELLEMAAPDRVASVDAFMAGFGDAEEMFDHLQAEFGDFLAGQEAEGEARDPEKEETDTAGEAQEKKLAAGDAPGPPPRSAPLLDEGRTPSGVLGDAHSTYIRPGEEEDFPAAGPAPPRLGAPRLEEQRRLGAERAELQKAPRRCETAQP